MGDKKKVLYMNDDTLDFLSDDEKSDENVIIFDSEDVTIKLPIDPPKPKKPRITRSLTPPVFQKTQDPILDEILRKEKEILEYNSKEYKYDVRQRVLLLDIDMETKSNIMTKLDQPSNIFGGGDQAKLMNWANNLTKIPFGKYNKLEVNDNYKYITKVQTHLNSITHGHTQAKEQILEFIAKLLVNPESKGNVIALQGSAGTGKTSLIRKGLAKALNRPFYSINFGGMTDTSVLAGHSSTYVGSKYGRFVDILIKSKCMNPIIYLDEIDKISSKSSNASTEVFGLLTHVLDEEQNHEFLDNYFDGVKIDLSKVLFVISFNNIDNIDKIVSDRLKIIYIEDPSIIDKIEIAKYYLIPEILKDFKMEGSIIFKEDEIKHLITKTSEKGVRKLKKSIETIIEKINLYLLMDGGLELSYKLNITKPVTITKNIIDKLIKNDLSNYYNHFYI